MNTQYKLPTFVGLVVSLSSMTAIAEQPELSPNLERVMNSARTIAGTPVVDLEDPSNNPENVQRVMRLVSEADFDFFFPQAAAVYDYQSFLQAVAKFPAFCNEAADASEIDEVCAREVASVFAHFTQETGGHNAHDVIPEWRQGLYHITEMGCSEEGAGCEYRGGTCEEGTWQAAAWPCAAGKKYFGRGAKQLSYNYNYGQFSDVIFGDVNVLLQQPERVAEEGWLALSSAIWFAMTPQAPKPSMHEVITGFWQPNAVDDSARIKSGFGATTLIINGGIECGGSTEHAASANRIKYYKAFTEALNVDHGDNLGCAGYRSFQSGGAGSLLTYWEKDWGQEGACKLVNYQTAYSVFKEADYDRCVEDMWGDTPQESDTSGDQDTADNSTSGDVGVDSCIVVTSWWPGECGVSNSAQTCNRGWGTFSSVDSCCDTHFPDSDSCGSSEDTLNSQLNDSTVTDNADSESTEEGSESQATTGCRSVSHISDAWCQAVECDDVYVEAGFCAVD